MEMETICVPSYWGTELLQKHILVQEQNEKLVVIFPGKNYSCELPLLYYAGSSAIQHGYDLLRLEYGYQAARTNLDLQDLPKVIDECAESIATIIGNYKQVVFISKSLGTIIAGEVHKTLGLDILIKHVFLTPLVDSIPYINTSNGIVIFGGKDPAFHQQYVQQIVDNKIIIEIPNADHGLETGNIEENLAIMTQVVGIYSEILRD